MKTWNLQHKKALITGATKGIGLAIAEEFLALGAEIFIVARTEADVEMCLAKWTAEGYKVEGQALDLSKQTERARLVQKVSEKWESLDILINNVGTNIRKSFHDYTPSDYLILFETNLFSTIDLTQKCFELLKKGANASVVNVASVAGMVDVQSGAPYGVTKAGEIQFAKHLAAEWAKHNIRVNTVSPWYISTPLTEPVLSNPQKLESILSRTPANRIGEAQEVAALVAFLAMDRASYITGQNIAVDGGFLAKGL